MALDREKHPQYLKNTWELVNIFLRMYMELLPYRVLCILYCSIVLINSELTAELDLYLYNTCGHTAGQK